MRYLKNKRVKALFISLLLLMIITIFAFLHSSIINPEDSNSELDIKKLEEGYDKFMLDNFSMVKRENGIVHFLITADKVIHRKRISKLFIYQNLKEIYMSGVRISLFIYDNASKNNNSFMIPFDNIGKSFRSFGCSSYMTSADYLAGNADIDSDILTRMLFDDIYIDIYLPNRKKISLTGKTGRLSSDFENIVFNGPAKIIASDGRELTASKIVWSKRFNGIYLPEGYKLQGNYLRKEAFFIIDKEGRLSKVSHVPRIDYKDLIEDKEVVFYSSLSKNMPAYAKFILGIP